MLSAQPCVPYVQGRPRPLVLKSKILEMQSLGNVIGEVIGPRFIDEVRGGITTEGVAIVELRRC